MYTKLTECPILLLLLFYFIHPPSIQPIHLSINHIYPLHLYVHLSHAHAQPSVPPVNPSHTSIPTSHTPIHPIHHNHPPIHFIPPSHPPVHPSIMATHPSHPAVQPSIHPSVCVTLSSRPKSANKECYTPFKKNKKIKNKVFKMASGKWFLFLFFFFKLIRF